MKRDIDGIIDSVKERFANAQVYQLQVSHPADDNGLWYFHFPGSKDDIQIESCNGMCPFIIESNVGVAKDGRTVDEVVALICDYLLSVQPSVST